MNNALIARFADFLENTIKDSEFKFESMVSENNIENICGTICCAAGWLPRFDKEY